MHSRDETRWASSTQGSKVVGFRPKEQDSKSAYRYCKERLVSVDGECLIVIRQTHISVVDFQQIAESLIV